MAVDDDDGNVHLFPRIWIPGDTARRAGPARPRTPIAEFGTSIVLDQSAPFFATPPGIPIAMMVFMSRPVFSNASDFASHVSEASFQIAQRCGSRDSAKSAFFRCFPDRAGS
ncbi:hypothetical protein [Sinorhizobium arboris]|uniref:hypothetical protein n=1 Tax=Sinorhizobium arboris TaxID=76745 RepID=UPI000481411A|nr:hypothetical protein [Sinorhizobium arboris]